jgi:hypothetical protein
MTCCWDNKRVQERRPKEEVEKSNTELREIATVPHQRGHVRPDAQTL